MKRLILFACITGASFYSLSQLNWQKGGNSTAGGTISSLGTNNTWNAPLFFQTFGVNRTRLNGNLIVPISGYAGQNTSGYLGLGATGPTLGGSPVFNYFVTNSPLSMFHLNGRNGAFVQTAGYRPWMQTGVTYTDNQDFSYMGLRQNGSNLMFLTNCLNINSSFCYTSEC